MVTESGPKVGCAHGGGGVPTVGCPWLGAPTVGCAHGGVPTVGCGSAFHGFLKLFAEQMFVIV